MNLLYLFSFDLDDQADHSDQNQMNILYPTVQ